MNSWEKRRKCPACGKWFSYICSDDEWGFAYGSRLTCSYSCMRALERKERPKMRSRVRPFEAGTVFYRKLMEGQTVEQLSMTDLAASYMLDSPKKLRTYLSHWQQEHREEAAQIRLSVSRRQATVTRQQICDELGVSIATVKRHALKLGIEGERIGGVYMYTHQETRQIIDAILRVTA